jgi:tight adherence protein B
MSATVRLVFIAGGVLAGLGVWVAGMALTGRWSFDRKSARPNRDGKLITAEPRQVIAGAAVALTVYAVTGWVVMVPAILVGTLRFGSSFARRSADADDVQLSEALATWCERVRDATQAGAGMVASLHAAARSAPAAIEPAAKELAQAASTVGVTPALLGFARRLPSGVADSMVMAMVLAEQRGGRELVSLLAGEVEAIRHELAIQKEETAIRSRYRTAVRIVTAVIVVSMVGYRLLSPDFLDPYSSFSGQVFLGFLSIGVLASLQRIVSLSRRVDRVRLFDPASVATGWSAR